MKVYVKGEAPLNLISGILVPTLRHGIPFIINSFKKFTNLIESPSHMPKV